MYKSKRSLLVVCAALLFAPWLLAGIPAHAGAAKPPAGPSFVVQPASGQPIGEIGKGYFSLHLGLGQVSKIRAVIKNTSSKPITVRGYLVDGTQLLAGGVGFSGSGAVLTGAGAWMSLQPTTSRLAPGASRLVTAVIHMPSTPAPGDHVGGLAFEDTHVQSQTSGGHFVIKMHYREVIPIVVTTPGTLISSASMGKVGLAPILTAAQASTYLAASSSEKPVLKGSQATVVVNNTGNVLWKGTGVLRIGGLKNSTSVRFTVGTILVHSKATILVQVPSLDLAPGSYNMSVSLQSAVKSAPIKWSGPVGLTLPVAAAAATAVPNLALQPAHPAAAGTATTLNQGTPVTTTSSSQSISLILIGGGAVVLIVLGVGLGLVLSRRSSGRKPLPA